MSTMDLPDVGMRLRPITSEDMPRIAEIYNSAVPTLATMDTEPCLEDYWEAWLIEHDSSGAYCGFACCDNAGTVVGFVSLSPFAKRGGYRASAEVSIYIDSKSQESGVGEALCTFITDEARKRGFTMVVGMFTANNQRSRRILKRIGYKYAGFVVGIAVKNDTLIDMEIWQYPIPENWVGLRRLETS